MRVLQINSVCGIRSTGRIVAELAEQFIAEGHECIIAYGREQAPVKYEKISYKIGTEFNVKINAVKARIFDNEAFNAKRETEQFIKWANNYDPELLWIHNLHGYYINIDILFSWIKSRPQMQVKWTLHDCWAFTGHCSHFSYIQCEQWKNKCIRCAQKREYPRSLFKDNCNQNYIKKQELFCGVKNMTLITPSLWLANIVKESFLKEYPIEVIYNKIDHNAFRPIESDFRKNHNLQNKIIVLGVASAWSDRKGLKDYIQLSQILDSSFKIVLVGLTKKQIKSMPTNVLCIERTNSKHELAEIYTAANVFLNLTYEDTYPTVNLEALSCGTPCITYRTGGSIESVLPEYVLEQGDLTGIFSKLMEIKANI